VAPGLPHFAIPNLSAISRAVRHREDGPIERSATIRDHNKKSPGGVPGLFANQASHTMN
jgi:hypothetical protein